MRLACALLRGGGGVGIYIKNHLAYNVLKQYSVFIERIFESLFVEISLPNNKKIVVGNVYRPGTKFPGLTFTQQFNQFSETLSNLLADIGEKYEHVFVYGDFNLNVLDLSNKFISEYIENVFSFGFLQLVTKPTRIRDNSATLIDHILCNSVSLSHDIFILCSHLSDHFPVIHQFDLSKPKISPQSSLSRNFSPVNVQKFCTAIKNYRWDHVMEQNCVQEATNNFLSTFDTLYQSFFPLVTKKFNRSINPSEPWMSSGILISRKRKQFLSKTCLKNPTAANTDQFKRFRNLYNLVIKTAKKLYYEKQLTLNQKNLRKTWQILFSSINKSKKK